MGKVKVRPWARIMPGMLWAVIIDALDSGTLVSYVAAIISPIVRLSVDALQALVSFAVYEDVEMWAAGTMADSLLPPGLEIFPTYTAMYYYKTTKKD